MAASMIVVGKICAVSKALLLAERTAPGAARRLCRLDRSSGNPRPGQDVSLGHFWKAQAGNRNAAAGSKNTCRRGCAGSCDCMAAEVGLMSISCPLAVRATMRRRSP